ncbi:hypothetical protein A0H81_00464 [Grifola frondosa]|uniref:Uncharacterized protein n=1 Tax=Grifola frondosa TaxID=5627 RepID=A0A1C7MT62_GRIFR|nr:hypothetical protein A0H81_00464 [Grifola frondosa]
MLTALSTQHWQRCSLAKMLLIDLPFDILSLLPDHVASLDDLHALILTSRTLYESASNPPPPPSARALADWSIQSPETRDALFTAISSTGLTALLDLALEVSPLTLADLSFLARMLKTVLTPVANILRTALSSDCSPHYPNFQLLRMLTHYWIYCDLFYHTISYPVLALTTNCKPVEPLSEITRREWIGKALSDNFSAYIKVNAVEDADAIYSIILSFFCNNLMDRVGGIAFHNSVFHKASYDYCAAHQGITTLKIFLHRTQERRAGPAAEVKELAALGNPSES